MSSNCEDNCEEYENIVFDIDDESDMIYNLIFVDDEDNKPESIGDFKIREPNRESGDKDYCGHAAYYTVYDYKNKSLDEIKAEIVEKMKNDEFVMKMSFSHTKKQLFVVFSDIYDVHDMLYNEFDEDNRMFKIKTSMLDSTKHIKSAKR
jgi:hypothetical protein